jgi:hypothetical protein
VVIQFVQPPMEGPVAINIARVSDLFGRKASVLAAAGGIPPAIDGSDPATWDPTLDGAVATCRCT